MKEKHFSRYEKDGKLEVTGNELLVSLDDTKSIEYPRVQLGNCFRGRNVYFFSFIGQLSDSITSRGATNFEKHRGFRFFSLPPVVDSTAASGPTCFSESSINGLNDRAKSSKFEENAADEKYYALE